jgi:hypothetical protein
MEKMGHYVDKKIRNVNLENTLAFERFLESLRDEITFERVENAKWRIHDDLWGDIFVTAISTHDGLDICFYDIEGNWIKPGCHGEVTVVDNDGAEWVGVQSNVIPFILADKIKDALQSSGYWQNDAPAQDAEAERALIRRQLSEEKENLLLIQERKSEHVMDIAISLDLIKQERRTQKRIEELEQRMMR